MTRTLTYSAFAAASIAVIMVFISAKTYSQLAVAAVVYPILVVLALMLFPRKSQGPQEILVPAPKLNPQRAETAKTSTGPVYIADIDRRTFLKLVGATGISFFLFSLFGRRLESLIFGPAGQTAVNPQAVNTQSDPNFSTTSPTEGYKISEIEEGIIGYYGFINSQGAWLIMKEDENSTSFRYAKGSSDFPGNWANRENLKYDYFYNLFQSS